MKILFEEDDRQSIESLRRSKESGKDNPLAFLYDEEEYSVSFKVIDSVKANAFILEFMRTDDIGRRKIEDAIGIQVKAVSNATAFKLDKMKELIKEFECKAKEILKSDV